jgi:predicted acylesterase/phospholipase RssA
MADGHDQGATSPASDQPPGPLRVLSIDGGGVRGVIPARLLVELERLAGVPITKLFDVVAGTSTGGIIALLLAHPGAPGSGPLSAAGLLELYHTEMQQIFPQVEVREVRDWWDEQTAKTAFSQRFGAALLPHHYGNARYLPTGLEDALERMLGHARLSDAVIDVVIPAYDMRGRRPVLFRSAEARAGRDPDLEMRLVARATSAAPTYFPPLRLADESGERVLVDGGLVANNPVTLAYFDALERCGGTREVLIVSLGTGLAPEETDTYEEIWSRTWPSLAMGLLGVVFDGTSELSSELVRRMIDHAAADHRYWRFQTQLHGCSARLDDATPGNAARLFALADALVAEKQDELQQVAVALRPHGGDSVGPPVTPTTQGEPNK